MADLVEPCHREGSEPDDRRGSLHVGIDADRGLDIGGSVNGNTGFPAAALVQPEVDVAATGNFLEFDVGELLDAVDYLAIELFPVALFEITDTVSIDIAGLETVGDRGSVPPTSQHQAVDDGVARKTRPCADAGHEDIIS
ncbi:hypothetical protein [uncultured Methylobacterium sp.]|uniref:hypothetical protein n=1 Tax=uncultured Methylobacterium sp. TaxID=157278 RepID=UPI0026237BE6|nr:hypothetical protein [uncultured Methylobacterium sp.]